MSGTLGRICGRGYRRFQRIAQHPVWAVQDFFRAFWAEVEGDPLIESYDASDIASSFSLLSSPETEDLGDGTYRHTFSAKN